MPQCGPDAQGIPRRDITAKITPNGDNEHWLKWIEQKQVDGKREVHTVPVPLNDYPIKPYRYYMDNFSWPTPPKAV